MMTDTNKERGLADNYVVKKTWDEAAEGKEASGDYETIRTKPEDRQARYNGGGKPTIVELRNQAEERGIDHAGMSKAQLAAALEDKV